MGVKRNGAKPPLRLGREITRPFAFLRDIHEDETADLALP
jgi:hypothetical protein